MAKNNKSNKECTWESLVEFKNDVVSALASNQSLIVELYKNIVNNLAITEDNKKEVDKLNPVLNGVFKSYGDIADKLRFTSEKHCTYDNNVIVNNRTGVIEPDNIDDYTLWLSIANEYVHANDQIQDITNKVYMELMVLASTMSSSNNGLKEHIDGVIKEANEVLKVSNKK